jgi:hypothetical protein
MGQMSEYTTMRDCLKLDLKDAVAQRNEAIQERERWKMQAEQKWGMRRELEELLGVKDTQCDEQFAKGLAALRDLIKERDEARELAQWFYTRLKQVCLDRNVGGILARLEEAVLDDPWLEAAE